ncbi:hypothetical protein AB6C40_22875 [Vibrio splendidus]|uniref:hypothetical protein n=1 Tax=Vibrio cyclitrophicus TaxID=47951 RepID=UPI000382A173|nr:hypothetical protein [Vibrio cyclitrophicus]OEF80531.1 hypothetical protein OA5_01215 [Vibrio cyclitrophicus 1F111]
MKLKLLSVLTLVATSYVQASALPLPQTPQETVENTPRLQEDLSLFQTNGFTASCDGSYIYDPDTSENQYVAYNELCVVEKGEDKYVIVQSIDKNQYLNAYLPGQYLVFNLKDIYMQQPGLALLTDPSLSTSTADIFDIEVNDRGFTVR